MTYVEFYEDEDGNLIDVDYYCSAGCFSEDTGKEAYGHAWPCNVETDYTVYCSCCGDILWHALSCWSQDGHELVCECPEYVIE